MPELIIYDWALLHPDGRLEWGRRGTPGSSVYHALTSHIPDVSSQGAGEYRMWFSDTFTAEMPPNPYADHVLGAIGYRHPLGWYGIVGLSMEEAVDGVIPPLTDKATKTVMDKHAALRETQP